MGKISTYPIDATPQLTDKVIGTEVNNSQVTRNYLLSDVFNLFISQGGGGGYVPYTGAIHNVDLGSYGLIGNFLNITKQDGYGVDVSYSTTIGGYTNAGIHSFNNGTTGWAAVFEEGAASGAQVQNPILVKHSPSGSISTGVGVGISFQAPDTAGTAHSSSLGFVSTDAAPSTYTQRFSISPQLNGAATRQFSLHGNGNTVLGNTLTDLGYKLQIIGDAYIDTIANAVTDTDKFLVSDGGVVKYRTGAQLLSDIGAAPAPVFGYWYDTTTQTCALGGIEAMQFGTAVEQSGVSVLYDIFAHPTKIAFTTAGVYNLQFSAQLQRTTGGSSKQVVIWLRVDGVDVPDTSTHVTLQANATFLVASWNFFQRVTAGQYVQIMWTQDDAITIAYDAANLVVPYPATPSIILTVNKIAD